MFLSAFGSTGLENGYTSGSMAMEIDYYITIYDTSWWYQLANYLCRRNLPQCYKKSKLNEQNQSHWLNPHHPSSHSSIVIQQKNVFPFASQKGKQRVITCLTSTSSLVFTSTNRLTTTSYDISTSSYIDWRLRCPSTSQVVQNNLPNPRALVRSEDH